MAVRYRITYVTGKTTLLPNMPMYLSVGEKLEAINWVDEPSIKDWDTYRVAFANMCHCNNRIEAIKLCRMVTGWDLRTAKTYIDQEFSKL